MASKPDFFHNVKRNATVECILLNLRAEGEWEQKNMINLQQ